VLVHALAASAGASVDASPKASVEASIEPPLPASCPASASTPPSDVLPDAPPEVAPEKLPDGLPAIAPDESPEADPVLVADALPEVVPDPLPDEAPEVPEEAGLTLDPQPTTSPRVKAATTRASSGFTFANFRILSLARHVACRAVTRGYPQWLTARVIAGVLQPDRRRSISRRCTTQESRHCWGAQSHFPHREQVRGDEGMIQWSGGSQE
jgi:hypothetical protein